MNLRRQATMYLLTLVWVVLTMGIAQAQTPDPVTNAAAGFRTAHLVVDPAVADSISQADAQALDAELAKSSTPIMVAILPDSAVGTKVNTVAVEAAVYRLATTTAIPGTVGMILPQSHYFRATSSVVKSSTPGETDNLAIAAAHNYGKQGLRPMAESFIAGIRSAYQAQLNAQHPAPAPASHSPVGWILLALVAVGGVTLLLFASRRSRQARRTGKTRVTAAWNSLGNDLIAHSALADSDDETRRSAYLTAQSAYEEAGGNMPHARTPEDWSTIGEIVAEGSRAMLTAKGGPMRRDPPVAMMARHVADDPEPRPARHRRRNGVAQSFYPAGSYMGQTWGGGWYGGNPWLADVVMYEAMEDLTEDHDGGRDAAPAYEPPPSYDPPAAPTYGPPPSYDPSPSPTFDFGGGGFDSGGGGSGSGGDW